MKGSSAYADYVSVPSAELAPKPEGIDQSMQRRTHVVAHGLAVSDRIGSR